MERWRHVLEQEGNLVVDVLRRDDVEVIEDEDDGLGKRRQIVDQGREHHVDDARAGVAKLRERSRADIGLDCLQRGDDVCPEAGGVVVAPIEGDPCIPSSGARCEPLREDGRLAPARRRRDERELELGTGGELLDQARTEDEVAARGRGMNLRGEENWPGVRAAPRSRGRSRSRRHRNK
jgi:hypothetical protein